MSSALAQSITFVYSNEYPYNLSIDCPFLDIVSATAKGKNLFLELKANKLVDSICQNPSNGCMLLSAPFTAVVEEAWEGPGLGPLDVGEITFEKGIRGGARLAVPIPQDHTIVTVSKKGDNTSATTAYCTTFSISIVSDNDRYVNEHPVIRHVIDTSDIVECRGAYNLFYALNPKFKTDSIGAYRMPVIYPKFPNFKTIQQRFQKYLRENKDSGKPLNFTAMNGIMHSGELILVSGNEIAAKARISVMSTSKGGSLRESTEGIPNFEESKDFVFYLYKTDGAGNPHEIYGKYQIQYYTEGNESSANTASNATPGFASLNSKFYSIKVYDQKENRQVKCSDSTINPLKFFKKNERVDINGSSLIKIPIQLYD